MLENKRAETLRLLRESGKNVSGQELCEHFGISRTAVWKMMNQLKEEGYDVIGVTMQIWQDETNVEQEERHPDNSRDADCRKRPPRQSLEITGGNLCFDVDSAVPGS